MVFMRQGGFFMKKNVLYLLLILSLLLTMLSGCTQSNTPNNAQTDINQPETNLVTDVTGREVQVPANANNVMLLPGPAFEKTLLLGVADRIGTTLKSSDTAWARLIYPRIAEIAVEGKSSSPNIEEMLNRGTEFVICHDYADLNAQLDEINMPYVITQCSGELPYSDLEGFLAFQRAEVKTIAQAFGGEALTNAERWIEYFDEKVNYVRSRTDLLTDEQRPRVYYARSDEGLVTFSQNSYPHYLVELAGGYYVAKDTPEEMNSTLTIEQIMFWDPEIIFMGRMDDTAIIKDNPAWSGMTALKNNAVYLCPSGVFNWDYSGESVLLMLYLAKHIQPELFVDLDIKEEIRYYYSNFYGYDLTPEQIQLILNHMPPA